MYPILDFKHKSITVSRHCILKPNNKDEWFLTKTGVLVNYEEFVANDKEILLKGKIVAEKEDFYNWPLKSSLMDIYKSNGIVGHESTLYNISDFMVKMFKIPTEVDGEFVFSPLRHTYNL